MHKIVNGVEVELTPDEITELTKKWEATEKKQLKTKYRLERQQSYPPITDQIDAIYKAISALKDTLVLPKETLEWLTCIDNIKNKYPKPEVK
jgi:hypothetical protein